MLISRLGFSGHQDTINEAQRQFDEHINGTGSIHLDTRQTIFSVAAFNGDSSTVDQLINVLEDILF